MERLETKKINGCTYYYYSCWERVDGKCRRVWQKYLGKLEDLVRSADGSAWIPQYAEVFEWGLPTVLLRESQRAEIVRLIDDVLPKRKQGLSTGEYIAIAAINRAMDPHSKRSMWEWFSQTCLVRVFKKATPQLLTSQRFWDHMDRFSESRDARKMTLKAWKNILLGVADREHIDLSSISYDGTNFYTFIDTFNAHCQIAQRGKNKQGRCNLRQVSYALFCCADGQIPLYFDVYEGNCHDAKQFPKVLKAFNAFLNQINGAECQAANTTLVFDKGNNSKDNFDLIDQLKIHYVGSAKLDEHKELAQISNDDSRFQALTDPQLEEAKAFRTNKVVYGKERTMLVTFNQNLFNAQWCTVQNDIAQAITKLSELCKKLNDRATGLVTRGKTPTKASIEKQCKTILSRQYMKEIFTIDLTEDERNVPKLDYALNTDRLKTLSNTFLGKNIIITDQNAWSDEQIILAYRSQYLIEDVFKQMKDRKTGSWWPMFHWTDSKIQVHAFYCTIALMLRLLPLRRLRQAGISVSSTRFVKELTQIKEVINFYAEKKKRKTPRGHTTFTRMSEFQEKMLAILGIETPKIDF